MPLWPASRCRLQTTAPRRSRSSSRTGGDARSSATPEDVRLLGQEIEELAFGLVHQREVRPLPAGAIRVRVSANEWGWHPEADEIAACVARRILN
jgi:hypothetical protein